MTEESSFEGKLAQLTKRIDDQARFTRTLVVVCTAAVLAVNMWIVTETFSSLPTMIIASLMENMDVISRQYKALEESGSKNAPAGTTSQSTTK